MQKQHYTFNLITFIGIKKSFEGENETHILITWATYLIILRKTLEEILVSFMTSTVTWSGLDITIAPDASPARNVKKKFSCSYAFSQDIKI